MNYIKGDFVFCTYEGKEYVGQVKEILSGEKIKATICTVKKNPQIFEDIDFNLSDIKKIIQK